jgi:hypothetical protein
MVRRMGVATENKSPLVVSDYCDSRKYSNAAKEKK